MVGYRRRALERRERAATSLEEKQGEGARQGVARIAALPEIGEQDGSLAQGSQKAFQDIPHVS